MSTMQERRKYGHGDYRHNFYDVIIPAYNEEATIGNIVYQFWRHHRINNVYVMVDDKTTDNTQFIADSAGAITHRIIGVEGKGQLINWALTQVETQNIVLSDADYTRFDQNAVDLVAPSTINRQKRMMRLVVPRPPTKKEWVASGFPIEYDHVAWTWNTGLRSFPVDMIEGIEFHGYLVETQINKANMGHRYAAEIVTCASLNAPLRFTKERMAALEADGKWGVENGIL